MGEGVLKDDSACRMSPAEAGRAIAKRLGRTDAYSAQTVRNWIREGTGFPAERGEKDRFCITDPNAAAEWVRANKTEGDRGGARDGAGRKKTTSQPVRVASCRPSGEEDGRRDAAPTGDEGGVDGGNGFAGAAAETQMSRENTRKRRLEAKILDLKYKEMTGQLIGRDEAAEGTVRVVASLTRALSRLPDRIVDQAASRLSLVSEAKAALLALVTEEINAVRGELAADPLGLEDEQGPVAA